MRQTARPRTIIGLWLLATMLEDQETAVRYAERLNGGNPGWNPDEPAVVEAACELAARRLFGADPDVRDISSYVSFLRQAPMKAVPGQLELEAVIRSALGEAYVAIDDIRPSALINARTIVIGAAYHQLRWNRRELEELIAEAERMARDRGRNPPLAS